MNRILKTSTLATAIALTIGAAALPAAARGMSATGGIALPYSDAGCFSEYYGTLTNTCSETKLLRFSLQIDSTGRKKVWVFAQGAGPSNNVGCEAVGIDANAMSIWRTPMIYLPAFGSGQSLLLNVENVPGFGTIYVNCYVNKGGRVNSVSYEN